MQVFDNYGLVGIQDAINLCDSLELELRSSLDARHVRALRQAVQKRNNQISTVVFHLHERWDDINARVVVSDLVTTVALIPNLRELVVAGEFVPFSAITTLLHHASNLQRLILEDFRNLKEYDTQILVDFCRALQRHKSLKELTFKPQIEDTGAACEPQEISMLQMLMEALAESPVLREVELQTNLEDLTGPPLIKLCNSTTLSKLELRSKNAVGIDGLHALSRNASIEELLVSCQTSERYCSAVSRLLGAGANTTLKKLTVVLQRSCEETSLQRLVQAIADALRTNTTLTDLRMPVGSPNPSLGALQSFVDVFHDNYSLETLDLFHDMSKVQRANYDDIEKMPEGSSKSALLLGKRILYYTLLNRSGRGSLLSAAGPGRGRWVDKLIEFNYSLDHLYFFLRTNPTLCTTTTIAGPKAEKSDRMGWTPSTQARKRGRLHP